MTNEAPTQEMVEKSLSDVACGVADYSDCAVLRAHITALEHKHADLVTRCVQAESDRDALEAKLAEQVREDEMRLINHCVKMMGNNSKAHIHAEAEFLTKIAELEAENKRLLDAVKIGISAMQNSEGKIYGGKCKEFNSMQAALAQTGESDANPPRE